MKQADLNRLKEHLAKEGVPYVKEDFIQLVQDIRVFHDDFYTGKDFNRYIYYGYSEPNPDGDLDDLLGVTAIVVVQCKDNVFSFYTQREWIDIQSRIERESRKAEEDRLKEQFKQSREFKQEYYSKFDTVYETKASKKKVSNKRAFGGNENLGTLNSIKRNEKCRKL